MSWRGGENNINGMSSQVENQITRTIKEVGGWLSVCLLFFCSYQKHRKGTEKDHDDDNKKWRMERKRTERNFSNYEFPPGPTAQIKDTHNGPFARRDLEWWKESENESGRETDWGDGQVIFLAFTLIRTHFAEHFLCNLSRSRLLSSLLGGQW